MELPLPALSTDNVILNPLSSIVAKAEPQPPTPKLYTIVEKDTLEKIASEQHTSVSRLFSKNTTIVDPNIIEVGQTLTIPAEDEVLVERPVPVTSTPQSIQVRSNPTPSYTSSGNSYQAGQCVWFVKNMRPEIPNNWGNAYQWLASARNAGWPTGVAPKVNAVGVAGNHVVLITAVNGDGTVSYTDMNGRWVPYEIGYGTKPSSYFQYIY